MSLLEPMTVERPVLVTPSGPAEPLPPSTSAAVPPPVAPEPPPAQRIFTLEELSNIHRRVLQLSDAELRELAEAYRGAQAASSDSRIRQAIDERLAHIQLIADTRESKRRMREIVNAANQRQPEVLEEAKRWRQSRVYTMVGRLTPSLLYNGVDLPQMFRVESVGNAPGGPRTLGYVVPDENVVQIGFLGQVVGVVGQQEFDPALRLLIIRAERVDVLTPEE